MMWKHLKSGGVYTLLRFGLREEDLTPVAIYQEATAEGKLNPDGKVWVRPAAEFCDGRFVPLRHYRTTKKLIDEASYMINNPSAWETGFDQTASDVIAKLVAALDDHAEAVDPEQMAKTIAFAGRCQHDVSKDADEFWRNIHEEARDRYRTMAVAALSHPEGDNHAKG